jgi:prevent-host-death family protein
VTFTNDSQRRFGFGWCVLRKQVEQNCLQPIGDVFLRTKGAVIFGNDSLFLPQIDLLGLCYYCVRSYSTFYRCGMNSVSVNKFRDNLKFFVEQVVSEHLPLKVTRRSGDNFVVLSADDWEREQETLYVLFYKIMT